MLQARFGDVQKPKIAIRSPLSNQKTSNSVFRIEGSASDNVGVARVLVQVNKAGWGLAAGTSNWSAMAALTPGTNLVNACAVDGNGNFSVTNSVKMVYAPSALLIVRIFGDGTVTPDYNNNLLQVGKAYTIKAQAAQGSRFLGWSGSISCTNATLSFTMASNLTFTAAFEPVVVDTNRPVNIVTFPTVGSMYASELITVRGKATDNVGVAQVWYQLNSNGWNAALTTNSWTNWETPQLTLLRGANVIEAVAQDKSRNRSLTNRVRFYFDKIRKW